MASERSSPSAPAEADAWTVLARDTAYDGAPFVRVERQRVRLPDGRVIDDYHRIALSDFAIGIPLLEDGRVLTQWQYKHGVGRVSLTFPAGHIEPGESPEVAMRRELVEETGHVPARAIALGSGVISGNQGCGRAHFFALIGCRCVAAPEHDDLETWQTRLMRPAEIEAARAAGDIAIVPQLAAWLTYLAWKGST